MCRYNFIGWNRNPRIWTTFILAFILCFLLSNKVMKFSIEYGTSMQLAEPFLLTFGDADSILLASLLLVLLFCDMPFLSPQTPYFLFRTSRRVWLAGQLLYVVLATTVYMIFIFLLISALRSSLWGGIVRLFFHSASISRASKKWNTSFPLSTMLMYRIC